MTRDLPHGCALQRDRSASDVFRLQHRRQQKEGLPGDDSQPPDLLPIHSDVECLPFPWELKLILVEQRARQPSPHPFCLLLAL